MSRDGDFKGKSVFITGGTAGIGFAFARCFAELGAYVAITGRDPERTVKIAEALQGAVSSKVIGYGADVRSAQQVSGAIDAAAAAFDGIDILVNSAGVAGAARSEELAESEWDRIIDTNLKGTFLACQAAARHMLPRKKGAIINLASVAGLGGFPKRAAYGSSKAAVIMLTKVLAIEWADRNVRVNALAPGIIRTELHEQMVAKGDLDVAAIERRTPAGHRGETTDLLSSALFLASDSSNYVTGSVIAVDGGWSAYSFL